MPADLAVLPADLDTVPDMDRVIEYALGERLGYTPGTGFRYSNLGYLILTKVVEICSGMDYEEYCQENILHPAGCYDMHLAHNLYEDRYPNEVRYYETHDAEPVPAFDNSGDTLYVLIGCEFDINFSTAESMTLNQGGDDLGLTYYDTWVPNMDD